eukprot:IDg12391t1
MTHEQCNCHFVFCFKQGSRNTIYRFVEDKSVSPGGKYGYYFYALSVELKNPPRETDLGTFDCVADGHVLRIFFKKKRVPTMMYQLATGNSDNVAVFGRDDDHFDRILYIHQFPDDADHSRFFVYKRRGLYIYGCLRCGSSSVIYSGSLTGARFVYGRETAKVMTLDETPPKRCYPQISAWSSNHSNLEVSYMLE